MGFYAAPVQALANGGVLVIDDFGRQHCSPRDLLNRWIVPLESRVDFLTLQTGQKFDLPFLSLVVFATNIRPAELVDEAFLRRIHYKVFAESPTRADFAWWLGILPGAARPPWDSISEDLAPAGPERWMLSDDEASFGARTRVDRVRLLPAFDPYLLGHKDRDHIVDAADAERIYRKQAWISPTVIVDGEAVAVWSHTKTGPRVVVEVEPFRPLAREVTASIADEAASLASFLGGDPDLRIG